MAVEVEGLDVELLRSEIQHTYTAVSREPDREFMFPTGLFTELPEFAIGAALVLLCVPVVPAAALAPLVGAAWAIAALLAVHAEIQ